MRKLSSFALALLERAPEPATWLLWVKFTTIETGIYRPFLNQCQANNSEQQKRLSAHEEDAKSPLGQVRGWARLAELQFRAITCFYLLLLLKYSLLSQVDQTTLGYLDCLVPGRFRFVGRTNKISGQIAGLFLGCFLIYRLVVHLRAPAFKFYALEFLMHRREDVLAHEMHFARNSTSSAALDCDARQQQQQQKKIKQRSERAPLESTAALRQPHDSVAFLQSPLDGARWILRPNRTLASWRTLTLCTKLVFYLSIYVLVFWAAIMYLLLSGSILSSLGFEMSYPACVSWLRSAQASRNSNSKLYEHIYRAPTVLAHEIPIDDIPLRIPIDLEYLARANAYTLYRVGLDVLENHAIYLECITLFFSQFYVLALNAIDVVVNAHEIKARLERLVWRLETRQAIHYQAHYWCEASGTSRSNNNNNRWLQSGDCGDDGGGELPLGDEIDDLQAILADHFYTLTRGYNRFVTFILSIMGLCWLSYTLIVCVWMRSVRSRAIEFEFLLAESSLTLFCLALMSGAALVRSRNLQLYRLITRAMALDSGLEATKPRWISILKYFYPRPFHCFTIFGSSEISVLLGLKLISWILSAFIVLANFFYTSPRQP